MGPSFLNWRLDMLIPSKLFAYICNMQDAITDVKEDSTNKIESMIDYASKNPDKIILGISVLASLLRSSQSLLVNYRNFSQRRYSERTYYDQHTHTRWHLKRQLSNYEKKTLNERINNGEHAADILTEMGVLK